MTTVVVHHGGNEREAWWPEGVYRDRLGCLVYDGDNEVDGEWFEFASTRLGNANAPGLLINLYNEGQIDLRLHPGVVASAWSMAQIPSLLLANADWLELFEAAGYTHDGEPSKRPCRPVRLYRGCTPEGVRGMAWSATRSIGEWGAARFPGGALHTALVDPVHLLAYINGGDIGRGEDEFVVDTSAIVIEPVGTSSTETSNDGSLQQLA